MTLRGGRVRLLVGAAALVACGLHGWYWYAQRARTGAATGLPAAVLASNLPVRLWVAYPHQNLGAVAGSVPDFDAWIAAVGRLAELSVAELPRFGPFRVPPARGLALASGTDGELMVAAEVYPTIAVLARLAGKLASNPWLAGGQVEVDGRRVTVGWTGLTGWWAASAGAPPTQRELPKGSPALAALRLRDPIGALPAGEILVVPRAGGLEAVDAASLSDDRLCGAALPTDAPLEGRPILIVLAAHRASASGPGGLLLWGGGGTRLPELAVLNAPGGSWELPAEALLGLTGSETPRLQVGGLEVRAYENRTLDRAGQLLATLPDVLAHGGLLAWIDPGPAGAEAGRVHQILRAIPLLPERDVRRWRDLATVLAPLESRGPLSFAVSTQPACVRLRLSTS